MASGATHHKLHGLLGWGVIIGLPFVICSAVKAIRGQTAGLVDWLSGTAGGLGFMAFFTAAIWYCKLEFDEVIMDYFDGGLKSFALLANRIVSLLVWLIAAYAIAKLAFLG